MFEVTVKLSFSAAHRVEDYPGNCERLHGHNWVVELVAGREQLDGLGMVVDFRKLREAGKKALSSLDHAYLNEVEPFRETNPTAENLARWIFDEVSRELPLRRVNVHESEGNVASYFGAGS